MELDQQIGPQSAKTFCCCMLNKAPAIVHCIKRLFLFWPQARRGDAAQLVEHQSGKPLRQVQFPGAARDFSSQSQLSVQTLLYGVSIPPCTTAYINICAHVKDPVVHARVWWIMEL